MLEVETAMVRNFAIYSVKNLQLKYLIWNTRKSLCKYLFQLSPYIQTWRNNMSIENDPIITEPDGDYTRVTFWPDLKQLGVNDLDLMKNTLKLLERRCLDVSALFPQLCVFLNDKEIKIRSFKEYMSKISEQATGSDCIVYFKSSEDWEIGVALSPNGFNQISFVNGVYTQLGGSHVKVVIDTLTKSLLERRKSSMKENIKAHNLRQNIFLFLNSQIENPLFVSQTKEMLYNSGSSLTKYFNFPESFLKQNVSKAIQVKTIEKINKEISKLADANHAGSNHSQNCTLIITEGDSAKSLAVSGLSVVGRDYYGVYPLIGKILNVRESKFSNMLKNSELTNLVNILGLKFGKSYKEKEALKSLRYGRCMIMADPDEDGVHLKGLIINFFHHFWPALLKHDFLFDFSTPIIKASRDDESIWFYNQKDFNEWNRSQRKDQIWAFKYYKGLGTSSSDEAKFYFKNISDHLTQIKSKDETDASSMELAFSRSKSDARKNWLRDNTSSPEARQTPRKQISISDFVHNELIQFSHMDNRRSIPSLVDGLKPAQRKILFACFKRSIWKEVKVAQLAGSVAELTAYQHGEDNLMSTIIGLAQDFPGSNNLNLLRPIGQFGTRLNGGRDSASPRYIYTCLNPLVKYIFPEVDQNLLDHQIDGFEQVEPTWYLPIVPMILVNGCDGVGFGWASRILNHDLLQIIERLLDMLNGKTSASLMPSFVGFTGEISKVSHNKYITHGKAEVIRRGVVEISELPLRVWNNSYKETVLHPMLTNGDISDYYENHTDKKVCFIVEMDTKQMKTAKEDGLLNFFKLTSRITSNSMVLYDEIGKLKLYNDTMDILADFFKLRLEYYEKRRAYLLSKLESECDKLRNRVRFFREVIDGTLTLIGKSRKEMVLILKAKNYVPGSKFQHEVNPETELDGFDYLLKESLSNLTEEKYSKLQNECLLIDQKINSLSSTNVHDIYRDDLLHLKAKYLMTRKIRGKEI